jgi:acetyl coenzyme A synthetase (ADP forming)-like protein
VNLPFASCESDVALRDGSTALVRSVRPEDREALRQLMEGLSMRSTYFRFFTVPRSADREVARLLASDGVQSAALVADAGGRLVGVASYVRDPKRLDRAEVGFAVADAAQGHGIGTQLLSALAALARTHAIDTFEADVLGENHQMIQVFRDSGFAIHQDFGAGVYHVTLALEPTATVEARAAARAQVAAAASMRPFFEPRSVAVVGASQHRGKIGAEVLHNLITSGFTGQLFAVHPTAGRIQNVPAFPRVTSIPDVPDLAVICVPVCEVRAVVDDCIARGVKALVVITAGFAETGEPGRQLEADLLAAVRRAGIRMVGPNCMGLLNTASHVRLNATFSPVFPPSGRVAMLSQSGALGLAILDHAHRLQIGLSTFVSVGNKADVSGNDLLQFWEHDPHTDVILLYLESFGNPRKFSQIARRLGRRKPIVAVKAGRSRVGARAAASHTGALATSDAVVDALFHQCGVIRTDTMEELFDVTRVLSQQPVPRGRRVAILTNAGGPGILAADACEARGLEVATLSTETSDTLRALLPPAASVANPVDMIASATPEQYERALAAVLKDEGVDSAIVIFIPPMITAGADVAQALTRAAATGTQKPVLAVFMGSETAADLLRPIPSFVFPEAAAAALARATRYGEWRMAPEGCVPTFTDIDTDTARSVVTAVLARGGGWARPSEAQRLLTAAGISIAPGMEALDEAAAVQVAESVGYPVALKAFGPAIVHKTELGAIRLDLKDAEAVRGAFRTLKGALGDSMTGALVQEMVTDGLEMLVGAVEDPAFGPVVACALGGTTAELFADNAFGLTPLTDLDARSMIDGLRCAPLLRGYRGAPVADEAALRSTLLRISALATLCPEIQEIEINPLRVLSEGVKALDVRVRIEPPRQRPNMRRVQY